MAAGVVIDSLSRPSFSQLVEQSLGLLGSLGAHSVEVDARRLAIAQHHFT
jgi:hypothetical protein